VVDGHHRHKPLFTGVVAVDLAGTRPSLRVMIRSETAITSGRSEEITITATPFCHIKQHLMHFRFGANVNASRRLINDQHARVQRHAACEDHFC
jgi:hypothetical protein